MRFVSLFILGQSKTACFYVLERIYNLLFKFSHLLDLKHLDCSCCVSELSPYIFVCLGNVYLILPSSLPQDSFSPSYAFAARKVLLDLEGMCSLGPLSVQMNSQVDSACFPHV